MKATRFYAEIESDRTIRLPENVTVAPGRAEVIVLQPDVENERAPTESSSNGERLADRLARLAEEHGICGLPSDMAENHDHYAHGAAKGVDAL